MSVMVATCSVWWRRSVRVEPPERWCCRENRLGFADCSRGWPQHWQSQCAPLLLKTLQIRADFLTRITQRGPRWDSVRRLHTLHQHRAYKNGSSQTWALNPPSTPDCKGNRQWWRQRACKSKTTEQQNEILEILQKPWQREPKRQTTLLVCSNLNSFWWFESRGAQGSTTKRARGMRDRFCYFKAEGSEV